MQVKDEPRAASEDVILLNDARHSPREGPLSDNRDGFRERASDNAKFQLVVEVPTLKLVDSRQKRARIEKQEVASTKVSCCIDTKIIYVLTAPHGPSRRCISSRLRRVPRP